MKTQLTSVDDHGIIYTALKFSCPGCQELTGFGNGIHMVPVNTTEKSPSWDWNGDLERPTLSPSILTRHHNGICHSFLKDGVFEYLNDCEHSFAGLFVPIPDLPEWFVED